LSAIGNQTVTEGQTLSLPVLAMDSDGPAPLVLSETNTLPGNPVILTDNGDGTGTIAWTPFVGDAAGSPYTVTVNATDGKGASTSASFTISVVPNQSPALTPIANQTVTEGQTLSVPVTATDGDGPAPLTLTQTNSLPGSPGILTDHGNGTGTIAWTSAIGDVAGSPYTVTVTATDGMGASTSLSFSVTVVSSSVQPPYGGSAWAIPGQIEAENYDLGGSGIAYFDNTAGNAGNVYRSDNVDLWSASDVSGAYMVGQTSAGEWLEYTVNVASAGSYTLRLRVATAANNKQARILMNGADITGPIAIPNTGGWVAWQTISRTVNLGAGPQVMRLQVDAGSFNINWVSFTENN
jgi:hypothetical protein